MSATIGTSPTSMPRDILSEYREPFAAVIDHLKQELQTLRTGRAHPSMVENILVEAYGGMQPLVSLGSIANSDARTLVIEPWDKSLVKAIETALTEARLGMNPNVAGSTIRMILPPMTEEGRKGLVKVLGEKLEHARISVRNVRDEAKAVIQKVEKDKEISEDEKYVLLEELDRSAAVVNEKIKAMGEEKEKEIMTI